MEDNIAAGGAIRHLRFCKTYEEVPDKYIRYADDVVQDSIMAGGDVGPAYSFGQGGSYFAAVNEARTAEGVAPLTWDTDLARAALRIAMGEDSDTVLDELERQTGKSCALYSSYGMYPLPSWGPNLESSRKSAGISIYGASMCMLYSRT